MIVIWVCGFYDTFLHHKRVATLFPPDTSFRIYHGLDWHPHAEPHAYVIDDFDAYVYDIDREIRRIREVERRDDPVVLFGFSAGGLIACRYCFTPDVEPIDGLVLNDPFLHFLPKSRISGFVFRHVDWFCKSPLAPMQAPSSSVFREHLRRRHGVEVDYAHDQVTRAGFVRGAGRAQRDLDAIETPQSTVDVFALVANGTHAKEKFDGIDSDRLASQLARLFARLTIRRVDDSFHDCIFDMNEATCEAFRSFIAKLNRRNSRRPA